MLVQLASYGYYAMAERAGIEIYRYQPGFLHQKVLLVDDDIVSIGTANLDNRSFRLNFELSIVVADRPFSAAVEAMLARTSRSAAASRPGNSTSGRSGSASGSACPGCWRRSCELPYILLRASMVRRIAGPI